MTTMATIRDGRFRPMQRPGGRLHLVGDWSIGCLGCLGPRGGRSVACAALCELGRLSIGPLTIPPSLRMTIEQEQLEQGSRQADLDRVLGILRRRAGLIALCFVVVAAAAFGLSELQTKQYSASASLLFRNPGFAEELFGTSTVNSSLDPAREAATNQWLVGLKVVGKRTSEHLPSLSPKEVSNMVSVAPAAGEADAVDVTATSSDPSQAQVVANTFARQFIVFRAGTERSKLTQAKRLAEQTFDNLPPAQKAGPRGEALSRGAEKLGILASLQTGNAELVQPAELPTSPTSPKPLRNAVLGAMLGLLLGLGLAFLLERLNRRLRDPEEAQEAFDLPVLGTVPESKAIMASNEGAAAAELPFVENESFRMLRASLRYFNVDRDIRTVLVTSHAAGVGKSTVAWNLARVAASSSKAVIVETDLRNPTLSRQHGLSAGPGLAELLTHQVKLEEVIQAKPIVTAGSNANGGGRALDVIVAGALPPNPAELIESQAMSEALTQLAERYELVVIDTAPVGVVSDAIPLLREVDGVIVVARMNKSTRDGAERTREQLGRLEAPVLGVVANAIKARRGGKYGYGYYGGYYQRAAEQGGAASAEPSAKAPTDA
jgi:capsular exopolysaccharide synthesis family protein